MQYSTVGFSSPRSRAERRAGELLVATAGARLLADDHAEGSESQEPRPRAASRRPRGFPERGERWDSHRLPREPRARGPPLRPRPRRPGTARRAAAARAAVPGGCSKRRARARPGRVSIWSAIGLSVIATCCYQVGMVMQKIGADRMPRLELTLRQREVFGAFLRSPIWLGGMGVTIAGWLFFLAAIANAPVSIVQPVLGFGLCLLALFSVVFLKERLLPLEWTGVALMVAGIVLLGISGSRDAGGRGVVSSAALLGVSVALLALMALAIPLGRSGRGASLPVLLGFAAGVLIGLAALYTKGLFLSLESGLPWFAWLVFLPLVLAANIGGIWVQQAGFQHGRALIVVAMNAVTNKVVTIIGGMMTLGEFLPGDANLAAARLAGFVTILAGTAILTRFRGAEIGQATRAPVRA
ncbi:MAG: DMT family transporter [Deltaproteobacteria bacterium]|nr:MAG: DMT family transporter [Deltaproteobacteria bacterium]TMB24195.1 MAG: DMT family transporter [Deltaproteobacteria bacterium]